jgi:hypothetical protein
VSGVEVSAPAKYDNVAWRQDIDKCFKSPEAQALVLELVDRLYCVIGSGDLSDDGYRARKIRGDAARDICILKHMLRLVEDAIDDVGWWMTPTESA